MILHTFPSFLCISLFLFTVSHPFIVARRSAAIVNDPLSPDIHVGGHPSTSAPVAGYRSPSGNMASMKAEKPVGSQPFEQVKKGTFAKIKDSGSEAPTSKAAPNKPAQKVARGPKSKGKTSKPPGKQ